MRILVTDGMDKTALAQLKANGHDVVEQFYEPDALGAALKEFDVCVVRSATKVRAQHIDQAKEGRLKLIIRGGVGVDNIDVKYAEDNGITVRNTPRASSNSVAELAIAHMLSCARFVSVAGHTMREGKWEKKAYGKGIEIGGKTLGVIGYGRIGQALGRMAQALGMQVLAYDIFKVDGLECDTMHYVEMDELLAKSDFISLHTPSIDGKPFINAETIAKMKDGVVFIDNARGELMDIDAVTEAVESGKFGALFMDAFPGETGIIHVPHDEDIIRTPGMPYFKLKYLRSFVNVYHTPHMAFFTEEAAEQMAECGVNSIYEILTEGKSKHEIPC